MNINLVYVALAIVFALVVTYTLVYNTRLKARQRTLNLKGREPVSKEEGIAIATQEKERAHRSGSIT